MRVVGAAGMEERTEPWQMEQQRRNSAYTPSWPGLQAGREGVGSPPMPHALQVLRWATVALGLLAVGGTLLSFSRSPRPLVRVWDFPRAQLAALAVLAGALYAVLFAEGGALEGMFLGALGLSAAWQLRKVHPYTPLARRQVEKSRAGAGPASFRLLISNVRMENREHDRLLRVVRDADPDVILALETDDVWARALAPLARDYPHAVWQPQANYYGLVLLSRLPLVDPCLEFLVQDDIPSVRAGVRLPSGDVVRLYGLHPRPPEPVRDQDATPRDAELVVVARAIRDGEPDVPTVVAGDLNDVAWSPSSELFMRLSGLLDPRVGRGLFNSFNAENPLMRYPLDHVFHSRHFRLLDLRRLPKVGSDHFPMLVALSYEPDAPADQPDTPLEPGDLREADEKLEREAEEAQTGEDRPGRE